MRRCKKDLVRCFLVATVLAGCVCLLACQRTPTELTELEEDESITVRQSRTQNLSGLPAGYEAWIGSISGDKMWILAGQDDITKETVQCIVDLNDWSARRVEYEDGNNESGFGDEIGEDESLTIFYSDVMPLRFYVKRYDKDGRIVWNQEVTDLITQVKTEGVDVADGCIIDMHTAEDKVIIVMAYQLIVLTDDCTKAEYIPLEDGQIVSSAKMKDGQIICAVEKGRNRYLQAWEPGSGKWKDSVKVINYWSFKHHLDFQNKEKGMLLDGSEYDFYYKNYYYIYGINWEDKTCVKLIDNKKSGIDDQHDEQQYMMPLWNGDMLSVRDDSMGDGEDGFRIYVPKGKDDADKWSMWGVILRIISGKNR